MYIYAIHIYLLTELLLTDQKCLTYIIQIYTCACVCTLQFIKPITFIKVIHR